MPDDEGPPPEATLEAVYEPDPPPKSSPLTPVTGQERIALIDVLRGLAVFGILLINMPLYLGSASAFFNWENNPYWTSYADRLTIAFIYIFAQGKFYTLFSFLFGLGFGVQITRAAERNSPNFLSSYRRRLVTLLVIGLLHFFLVWWGDVLHVYALLGFLLLSFRERSNRTLLIWVASLTFIPLVLSMADKTFVHITRDNSFAEEKRQRNASRAKEIAQDVRVYSSGSVLEIFQHRANQNFRQLATEASWATELFANFLLGLWVSRQRIFQNPQRFRPLLTILAFIALPIALLVTTVDIVYGFLHPGMDSPLWRAYLGLVREFLGRPLVAFGYAALLLLIGIRSWMTPLAAAGRMPLSNYLLQSLVFTTIANSYGSGLYGKVHPATSLQWCFVFFALQLVLSVLWLKLFQIGPAEWFWRLVTYSSYKGAK